MDHNINTALLYTTHENARYEREQKIILVMQCFPVRVVQYSPLVRVVNLVLSLPLTLHTYRRSFESGKGVNRIVKARIRVVRVERPVQVVSIGQPLLVLKGAQCI